MTLTVISGNYQTQPRMSQPDGFSKATFMPISVQLKDDANNPLGGRQILLDTPMTYAYQIYIRTTDEHGIMPSSLPLNGHQGILYTDNNGIANFDMSVYIGDGAFTINAHCENAAVNIHATVCYPSPNLPLGSSYVLSIVEGNKQYVSRKGTDVRDRIAKFAALKVKVVKQDGTPAPNILVTFQEFGPKPMAIALLAQGITPAYDVTNDQGIATLNQMEGNSVECYLAIGKFTINATIGNMAPVTFDLEVIDDYHDIITEDSTSFDCENNGTWLLTSNDDLAYIKTRNCGSGKVEIHIVSKSSKYELVTRANSTFFDLDNNGTWLLTSNDDLAFVKTRNCSSEQVEIHIASKSSDYNKISVVYSTTFEPENDGIWLLTTSDDLVFIKTSNCGDEKVEIHIASRVSDYKVISRANTTIFNYQTGGTWLLTSNDDLAYIKTSNTANGKAEVYIALKSGEYMKNIIEYLTDFDNDNDGTWLLTATDDLVYIKTIGTSSGKVTIAIMGK